MIKEEELEKQIKELEEKLKDREDALPVHSVKPNQMLVIDELETAIDKTKKFVSYCRFCKNVMV